jgi:drug/metabolite transporter (DMT)-like permease
MSLRLLTILTIAVWSTAMLAGKLLSEGTPSIGIFLTTLFASLLFIVLWLRSPKPRRLVISARYLGFGLCGSLVYYLCFLHAFRALPSAALAAFLNYTWPFFTVVFTDLVFSRVAKKPWQRRLEALGISLGVIALAIHFIVRDSALLQAASLGGITWGLGAGMSYGLFGAFSGTVPPEDRLSFLLNAVLGSCFGSFAWCVASGELWQLRTLTLAHLAYGAYNGLIIDGLGELFWTRANQRAADERVSIAGPASLMFFLPPLSIGLCSLILREDEMFKPYFIASLGLLVLGSVLCQKAKTEPQP